MINWKSLFGDPPVNSPGANGDDESRKEMLQKLFAANKGLSKLTGKPAETEEEMMSNEELVKMMGRKYFPEPEILGTEDGEDLTKEEILDVEAIESVTLDMNEDDKEVASPL